MIVVFWSWISDGLNTRNSSVRTVRWWDTQAWQERYQNGSKDKSWHPLFVAALCVCVCARARVKMRDWTDCVWHVAKYPRCPSYRVDMLSGYVEDTPDHYYYWLLQMIYQLDTIELCQQLIAHLYIMYLYLYHSIYLTCIYIIYSVYVFTPKKTYTNFEVQLNGHGTHFDDHKIPATPTSSSCKEAAPFTPKKRESHIFNPPCIFHGPFAVSGRVYTYFFLAADHYNLQIRKCLFCFELFFNSIIPNHWSFEKAPFGTTLLGTN